MPAETTVSELSTRLAETVMRQRTAGRERLARRRLARAPVRWLLTIGAILWFPLLQPVLEAFLREQDIDRWPNFLGLIVSVLGVNYLLKSAGFLVIWFLVLWLALRWNTQRRVARFVNAWKRPDYADPAMNLTTQALEWMAGLTEPVRRGSDQMAELSLKVSELSVQPKDVAA